MRFEVARVMKKTFLSVCVAAILCGGILCAQVPRALENILPADICKALLKEGQLQRSSFDNKGDVSCEYLPKGPLADAVKDYWSDDSSDYMREVLFLYKKSPSAAALSLEENGKIIERIVKSVSRLEGTTYFSSSRQEERLLYKRAFCISDAESKTPIPDPIDAETDGLSVLVVLEDLTFGENVYNYSFSKSDVQTAFFFVNETPFKYAGITGIKPGELKSVLLAEDLGDEMLIYGVVRANYLSFPGVKKRMEASISTRMDAMYEWFVNLYEEMT